MREPALTLHFPQSLYRLGTRLIANAGVDLFFVFFMLALLQFTLWRHGASLKLAQKSVLYPIGGMVFLLLTRLLFWAYRHLKHGNNILSLPRVILQTLRDWIPFIVIDFIYENLHDLSGLFGARDVAGTMMALDIKLFGVELTQASQRFFNPLLTDYMAFVYALYFILPIAIMYFLSYRNWRRELREIILALSLAFFFGFLGYVIFPCSPPRYYLEQSYTHPVHLYGIFIFNYLQGQWDTLSSVRMGAFPSLHVGISSIALIYAYRLRKRSRGDQILFIIYVPLVVSLWASTIYLRHHWFMDILAGWVLALFSCWAAPQITRLWNKVWRGQLERPPQDGDRAV